VVVRSAVPLLLLFVSLALIVYGVSLRTGRWLGTPSWTVGWGELRSVDPSQPLSLDQAERSIDDRGPLKGRVRRAADGGLEVRYERDDEAPLFLTLGFCAFTWFVYLWRRALGVPSLR
jgi:hypothetical protein